MFVRFHYFVGICVCFHVALINCDKIYNLMDSFQLLVNYFKNNINSITSDAFLGLQISIAQFETITKYKKTNRDFNIIINDLNGLIKSINFNNINYSNEYNKILFNKLKDNNIWHTNQNYLIYGILNKPANDNLSYNELLNVIDNGSPTAFESDKCIAELLLNQIYCDVSKKCIDLMSINNKSYGYHLTHKLLYFIIMNNINCTSILPSNFSVHTIFIQICSEIMNTMLVIENNYIPLFLRDLFLEQMFFCGYIGIAEFLQEKYIRNLILWQNKKIGCYNYFSVNIDDGNKRMRRNTINLPDNCSDHMSGVALATHSLIIKYSLLN